VLNISLDLESRSRVELKDEGVYRYSTHPSTDVFCACWATPTDLEEPLAWSPFIDGQQWQLDLLHAHAADPKTLWWAWNVSFERTMWHNILVPRYGLPPIPLERWRCTQANAMARGFPADLDTAARAARTGVAKDDAGHRLMMSMAKPKKATKLKPSRWIEDAESLDRLIAYCKQDVRAESAIRTKIAPMEGDQLQAWFAHMEMIERGIPVDLAAVANLRAIVDAASFERITDLEYQLVGLGETPERATLIAPKTRGDHRAVKAYAAEYGQEVASLAKDEIEGAAASLKAAAAADANVKRPLAVVEAYQDLGKSSLAKLPAFQSYTMPNSYAPGTLQFYAALQTGRAGGRGVQPQNMPRGGKLPMKELWACIERCDIDTFMWVCEVSKVAPLEAACACLRGCISATPGRKLVCSDWNAIEARLVFWLAGDPIGMKLFAEQDAGTGPDCYKWFAGRYLGLDPSLVDKIQRALGKVGVLGCGYGMWIDKFQETAAGPMYNLELSLEQCKEIVLFYRNTFEYVTALWKAANDAAIAATLNPGTMYRAGPRIAYRMVGDALCCRLPSGRRMYYPYARVADVERFGRMIPQLHFETMAGTGGKHWGVERTYGGKLVENFTQACGGELINHCITRLAPQKVVALIVHDELVADLPIDDPRDHHWLENEMCILPDWAAGLPLKAEGWTGTRYRK
jgi:DNA polymerase